MKPEVVVILVATVFLRRALADGPPSGNYFSTPFADNLLDLTGLVKSIVQEDEYLPTNFKLLFPDIEGSGDVPEGQRFTDFRKLTESHFEKMVGSRKASEGRTELKESIRDLRTDNTQISCSLNHYIKDVSAAVRRTFEEYLGSVSQLEKSLLDFLSQRKSEETKRSSVVASFNTSGIRDSLKGVLADGGVLKETLKTNSFADDIFTSFYGLLKNHAMIMAVTSATEKFMESNETMAVHDEVFGEWNDFLNKMVEANEWRENEGFKFEHLFTSAQRAEFGKMSPLPRSDRQNLFIFKYSEEKFQAKYVYFSIKACSTSHENRVQVGQWAESTTSLVVGPCTVTAIRHQLQYSNMNTSAMARHFRDKVSGIIFPWTKYDDYNTAESIAPLIDVKPGWNLMAIVATKYPNTIYDDIYETRNGYKVTFDVFVPDQVLREGHWNNNQYINKTSAIKVTGYFLQ